MINLSLWTPFFYSCVRLYRILTVGNYIVLIDFDGSTWMYNYIKMSSIQWIFTVLGNVWEMQVTKKRSNVDYEGMNISKAQGITCSDPIFFNARL